MDALRNHNAIRNAVKRVDSADLASDAWWDAIRQCEAENDAHLEEEERHLLPEAVVSMDNSSRASLGDRWQRYMHEHAHPGGERIVDPSTYIEDNA